MKCLHVNLIQLAPFQLLFQLNEKKLFLLWCILAHISLRLSTTTDACIYILVFVYQTSEVFNNTQIQNTNIYITHWRFHIVWQRTRIFSCMCTKFVTKYQTFFVYNLWIRILYYHYNFLTMEKKSVENA